MANNYDINYNDERFTKVESEKNAALSENEKTYDNMIKESDSFYQQQIDASKDYAKEQAKNQQEQTDFAIDKIEQQKEQTKKDYIKEQSGAYTDWQKQSNQYGVNAEQQASKGMTNGGYSESSQVSMYNTYQNRVATARETYNRAILNYDNAITEARLQNNSALAEIAYKAQQDQMNLALQGFQYKNSLVIDKANKKTEIENNYYNRYQDVLNQINTENALAEQIRQHNEEMAEEKRQFDILHPKSSGGSGGGSGGGSRRSSGKSSKSNGSSGGGAKIDKSSSGSISTKNVLDLGYGPISASNLNKKVESGEVKETVKNGKITFSRTDKAKKASAKQKQAKQKQKLLYSKFNF